MQLNLHGKYLYHIDKYNLKFSKYNSIETVSQIIYCD